MSDVHLIELAGRQHNRVSWAQLRALGFSRRAIEHRIRSGRLVGTEDGVYAVAPVLDDERGRWMGATLTAPGTFLSRVSGGAALGFWTFPRDFETVTRHGNGGPERHGNVLVFRSSTLDGETTAFEGIPITVPERILLDLATFVTPAQLSRALREALRLKRTTLERVADHLARHRGERGSRRLAIAAARYSGLPIERARSGAEVRALRILRDAGREMPQLNRRIAGEEADLIWPRHRLIIEIDGAPFHQDVGEDARKLALWEAAGWTVVRLPSDDVYDGPHGLLERAP